MALHGEDAGGDVEALDCAACGGAEEGGGDGRQVGEDVFVHLVDVLWGGGEALVLIKGLVVGGRHTNSSFPKSSLPFSVRFTVQTLTSHPPSTPSLR